MFVDYDSILKNAIEDYNREMEEFGSEQEYIDEYINIDEDLGEERKALVRWMRNKNWVGLELNLYESQFDSNIGEATIVLSKTLENGNESSNTKATYDVSIRVDLEDDCHIIGFSEEQG